MKKMRTWKFYLACWLWLLWILGLIAWAVYYFYDREEEASVVLISEIWVIRRKNDLNEEYSTNTLSLYKNLVEKFNQKHKDVEVDLFVMEDEEDLEDFSSKIGTLINGRHVTAIIWPHTLKGTMDAASELNDGRVPYLTFFADVNAEKSEENQIFAYRNMKEEIKEIIKHLREKEVNNLILLAPQNNETEEYHKIFKDHFVGEIQTLFFPEKDVNYETIENELVPMMEKADQVFLLPLDDRKVFNILKNIKNNKENLKFKDKVTVYTPFLKDETVNDLLENFSNWGINIIKSDFKLSRKGKKLLKSFKEKYPIAGSEYNLILEAELFQTLLDALDKSIKDEIPLIKALQTIDAQHPRKGFFWEYYFNQRGIANNIKYDTNYLSTEKQ